VTLCQIPLCGRVATRTVTHNVDGKVIVCHLCDADHEAKPRTVSAEEFKRLAAQPATPATEPPARDDITGNRHGGNPESNAAWRRARSHSQDDCVRILQYILSTPTKTATADEVEAALGMLAQTVSARCSEMKTDGRLEVVYVDGKKRTRLTRSGSPAAVLRVTALGRAWLAMQTGAAA